MSKVADQKGIFRLYIIVKMFHSGCKPSIYSHTGLVAHEGEGWARGQRDTLDLGCTGLTRDT